MAGFVRPTADRWIRKTVLIALAVVTGAAPAGAQARVLHPGDALFIGVGGLHMATGALDDRLTANGYPTFGRLAGTVGGGAYRAWRNRLLLGGEANLLVVGEKPHRGSDVALQGGFATIGVGYAFDRSRVRLYPRVGIGAGGLVLTIARDGEEVGFDEVLDEPFRPSRSEADRLTVLTNDGLVLDLGGAAELLPRAGRLLIGARAGYLATRFGPQWHLDERFEKRLVRDGPDATIAGPYVRVVVGVRRGR